MPRKRKVVRRRKQPVSIISDEIFIPNHSGMLDAGKVHRTPTDELDPVNKRYVDAQFPVLLDEVGNPSGDTTFTFNSNKHLHFRWTGDFTGDDGGFEIEAFGGFTGDLVHIHQHTGNPGAVDLLHLEADDADVMCLSINSANPYGIDMRTSKIQGLVDPTANQDAATKKYVDDNAGGGGAEDLDDLTDATITNPLKNQRLIYNGTNWVNVAENTSFEFSINTFTDNQSSTQEIGTGVWKAAGAITFSATYTNGPPTGTPHISHSGWSNLNMTNNGEGPTNSTEAKNYPGSPSSFTWTLNATDGEDPDTKNVSVTFYNRRHWGVTSQSSGYSSADIGAFDSNQLSNSRAKTFTVTAAGGEYIVYSYRTALGTATFFVGGFEGGFEDPETVSRTNDSGFTENFYVYRSTNAGLGVTEVTVT